MGSKKRSKSRSRRRRKSSTKRSQRSGRSWRGERSRESARAWRILRSLLVPTPPSFSTWTWQTRTRLQRCPSNRCHQTRCSWRWKAILRLLKSPRTASLPSPILFFLKETAGRDARSTTALHQAREEWPSDHAIATRSFEKDFKPVWST